METEKTCQILTILPFTLLLDSGVLVDFPLCPEQYGYHIRNGGWGYCHFLIAEPYSEEYFKQVKSEKVVINFKNGHPHRMWIAKRSWKRALDDRIYAMATLEILNPKKLNENMAKHIKQLNENKNGKPALNEPFFNPRRGRSQRDYVSGWMDL